MKHVHFIGIGGTGLSAIARFLLENGYQVSGSDRILSPLALELINAGIQVFEGHHAQNIVGSDLVIRSSAVPDDNPEVIAARAASIPVLKRSEFLGQLLEDKTGIAIAGTHGKTTTTAMAAWVFTALGQEPSYIIGGVSKNLKNNAHAGKGKIFVIEADEYDYMFLGLRPSVIILTSVEHDHPDCFPTLEDYNQAFKEFIGRLQKNGILMVCWDDPGAYGMIGAAPADCKIYSYGLSPEADFRAHNLRLNPSGGFSFIISSRQTKEALAVVDLQVPGEHNVRNALGVFTAAHLLGFSADKTALALNQFLGTGRRFDIQGEACGVAVIDDYAHHPTEIAATLEAARNRFPGRRIWAVWQPHTYTRTRTLMAEYLTAFLSADCVLITEIYAAREKQNAFSSKVIVDRITHPAAAYVPTLESAVAYLLENLKSGDVMLVLSAGDADQISAAVLAGLREKEAANG
ncbi:MAG: UDP-N-acetylmuramate--L-alanine ligase [Anaerolineae bacterium]|nr:UDP-N-acetylmuramate--L-alanine ligase [Anaerolineae bacterium]